MKKKILALALALSMLLCAVPSYAYSVREAYTDFVAEYPGFVDALFNQGEAVSESMVISFLSAVQRNLYNRNKFEAPVTEENFDDALVDAVTALALLDEYAPLQKALYKAYPDAATEAYIHHRISDEFMPLYNTVKSMIFDHNMLEEIDTSEGAVTQLVSIEGFDTVTVEQGGELNLPEYTYATSETGVKIKLDVEWKDVPSTKSAGTFTASGTVIIPGGFELGGGVHNDASVKVTVTKKDSSDSSGSGTSGDKNPIVGPVVPVTDPNDKVVHKYNFTDVNEATEAGKAIYALTDAGVINGYFDGTFKPAGAITRAEFTKMVVTALDMYDYEAKASFTDVAAAEWFYSYVASAAKNKLVSGYEDGSFRPAGGITRAEVMTIVYRVLNEKKLLTAAASNTLFADDAAVPAWSRSFVYALRDNGIVSADKDNKIQAEQPATREQCAVMLYNAMKKLGKIK